MRTLPVAALFSLEQLEPRALLSVGDVDDSYHAAFAGERNYSPWEDLVVMQIDGKSIHYARLSANNTPTIWREKTNGALDTSFGSGGQIIVSETVKELAVQPDGSIVALFQSSDSGEIHLARYTANGASDSSFGQSGQLLISADRPLSGSSIATQSDGKILVAGSAGNDAVVYRLHKNGTADNSFGSHGAAVLHHHNHVTYTFNDIAVGQADNRIVAVGDKISGGRSVDWTIFVLNNKGRVRRKLAQPTSVVKFYAGSVSRVLVDGDGALVVFGQASYTNSGFGISAKTVDFLVRYPANLRTDHAMEPEFHGPIALQSDGKILMAHWGGITRYTTLDTHDLSRDKTFVTHLGQIDILPAAIALQPDGNMLLDGQSQSDTQTPFGKFTSIRITGDSPVVVSRNQTLLVNGTSNNDIISATQHHNVIAVQVNGASPLFFSNTAVSALTINASGGDDTISLGKSSPAAQISGGAGDDTLIGKRRKDEISSIEHW